MSAPGEDPAADPRTDRELWDAHRDGDVDAFTILVRRHRDRLWAVALRTTGNREDAADALQDALVSAYTRAGSYRGDAAVTTWLHRVVVNACLDRLRRNKVRRADPLPDDLEEVVSRGALVVAADPATDPEAGSLASDRRRVLLAALDRIAPDQKVALVLVDMEGYPVEEVARILDCPTGTVKSRCARGRARLAEELKGTGLVPEPSHGRSHDASSTQPTGPSTGGVPT